MKQTKKYAGAIAILTFPHTTQNQLYSELNRLGYFWDSKKGQWQRNDNLPAEAASELIRVRVWAESSKVADVAEAVAESLESYGLKLLETSEPYMCRPPKQAESRVYLTFVEMESDRHA